MYCTSHLPKRKINLKQKCTQHLTPLSGTVFHALSHGEIHFAQRVLALKTNSIEASDWLLEIFHQSESGFWG